MVALFVKEVLSPGSRNGLVITKDDCRKLFDSVEKVHSAGLFQPLILEHAPLNRSEDSEGWPMQFSAESVEWQKKADRLRATVGTVVKGDPRNRINERGGVELVFAVPDEKEAEKFRDGRYSFVSPEILPNFKGLGPTMTHFAVTHRPFQRWQQDGFLQLSEPMQLGPTTATNFIEVLPMPIPSKPVQLADDDSSPPPAPATPPPAAPPAAPPPAAPPANPDMPKPKADDQKFAALIAQLAVLNLVLPSDTDESNLVDRLLTACMTKNAADSEAKTKGDGDGDEGRVAGEETIGGIQFSEGKHLALAKKVIASKSVPLKIRQKLLARVKAVQFSDDGEEVATDGAITISELLASYEGEPETDDSAEAQGSVKERVAKLLEEGKILQSTADLILSKVGGVQMSDSGEPVGDAVILVRHFEASPKLPPIFQDLTGAQLSDVDRPDDGETLQKGDPRAKEIAEAILKRQGR